MSGKIPIENERRAVRKKIVGADETLTNCSWSGMIKIKIFKKYNLIIVNIKKICVLITKKQIIL